MHWNYVATTSHRADEGKDEVKSVDASKWNKQKGGFYSFDNGHLVLWTKWADPSNRPLAPRRDELVAKYGEDAPWCAAGIGQNQITLNEWAVSSGGHARTGLEDNVRLDRDRLAPSNAALVRRVVDLCERYNRPVADWRTARAILGIAPALAEDAA